MLSKNQQKLIRSLQLKKMRDRHGSFLIEGGKIIQDLLQSGELHAGNLELLTGSEEWLKTSGIHQLELEKVAVISSPEELQKLSGLVTAPEVMAVVKIPQKTFQPEILRHNLTLALDSIRDPGNLGTIIRTADWFGIGNLVCSPDSVDTYNNKVVQSSMGAVIRLQPYYMDLQELFEQAARFKIPVYGTTMDGNDFFDTPIKIPGVIVFGNESRGISEEYQSYFRQEIRIPDFPAGRSGSESLNVATSVAVVCAELRRRSR